MTNLYCAATWLCLSALLTNPICSQEVEVECPTEDITFLSLYNGQEMDEVPYQYFDFQALVRKPKHRSYYHAFKGPTYKGKHTLPALEEFPLLAEGNILMAAGALDFKFEKPGSLYYRTFSSQSAQQSNPQKHLTNFYNPEADEFSFGKLSVSIYDLINRMEIVDTSTTFRLDPYSNEVRLSLEFHELGFSGFVNDNEAVLRARITCHLENCYGVEIMEQTYEVESQQMVWYSTSDYGVGRPNASSKPTEIVERMPYYFVEDILESALFKLCSDPATSELVKKQMDVRNTPPSADVLSLVLPAALNTSEARTACVTIETGDAHGSGCIISHDGYIITNYHVSGDGNEDSLKVTDHSGKTYVAQLVRFDPLYDLALIKIEADKLPSFTIENQRRPGIGDPVLTIGTPANVNLGQSVSGGVVSALRETNGRWFIQTDASVSPGNSGGALVNDKGKLIGIVNMKSIGHVIEGVGFAIPADEAMSRLGIRYK